MTPEETVLTPDEIRTQDVNTGAAQELSQLICETAEEPAEAPLQEPDAVPQPETAAQPEPVPQPEQPVKKPRWKPHILIRIPLQLLSFLLSVVMFVTALAGALVLDVQQLTSSGGIKDLVNIAVDILTGAPEKTAQETPRIAPLSTRLDETQTDFPEGIFTIITDENGNSVVVDENGNVVGEVDGDDYYVDGNGTIIWGEDLEDSLDDLLDEDGNIILDGFLGVESGEGVDGIIDWFYDEISGGEELTITKDQIREFVANSTVGDYLGEKLAGFAEDYINGTHNTVISADEIMALLEENQEALKEHLQIELTPDIKQELQSSVEGIIQETGINEMIREEVFGAVDEMLEESTASMGISMDDIRYVLQLLSSGTVFWIVIGINAGLLLLLCLLNFYNVPAGLTWASVPCIFSGLILSAPLFLMDGMTVEGSSVSILTALGSFTGLFKPIHYGLLAIGIGLLVISILWRIIRASRRAK